MAHAGYTHFPLGEISWKGPPKSRGSNSIYTNAPTAVKCQQVAWTFARSSPATFTEDYWAIVRGYKVGTAFPLDRSFSPTGQLRGKFYEVSSS